MDFSGGGRLGGIVYSYVNDVPIAPPTYRQQVQLTRAIARTQTRAMRASFS